MVHSRPTVVFVRAHPLDSNPVACARNVRCGKFTGHAVASALLLRSEPFVAGADANALPVALRFLASICYHCRCCSTCARTLACAPHSHSHIYLLPGMPLCCCPSPCTLIYTRAFPTERWPLCAVAAEAECYRYEAWPGQACAYKVGEIAIWRMRRSAEAALGDKFNLKDFHSVLLGSGPLPLDTLASLVEGWVVKVKAAVA